MSGLTQLVLDVLKAHDMPVLALSERIARLPGVSGVNCTIEEVDQDTESLKLTIEGSEIDYQAIEAAMGECGAVIHSVDVVVFGEMLSEIEDRVAREERQKRKASSSDLPLAVKLYLSKRYHDQWKKKFGK